MKHSSSSNREKKDEKRGKSNQNGIDQEIDHS